MALRSHLIVSVRATRNQPLSAYPSVPRARFAITCLLGAPPRLFRAIDRDLKRRPTIDLRNLALCEDFA